MFTSVIPETDMYGSDICEFKTKDRTIGGYALQISPPRVSHLRQNLSDFLFRRTPENAITREGAILIVDDERMMRHALKEMLADCYPERQIIDAGSGEDALRVFDDHSVAVIITDLVMPGLSGLEMMAIIRESVRLLLEFRAMHPLT
jgi:PleD family two-component response regulator